MIISTWILLVGASVDDGLHRATELTRTPILVLRHSGTALLATNVVVVFALEDRAIDTHDESGDGHALPDADATADMLAPLLLVGREHAHTLGGDRKSVV